LEGTWELVPQDELDPRLTGWFLTFDGNGKLARLTHTFADGETVTWANPPGSTNLDEDQLSVSVTFMGNGLAFDGTLDSVETPSSAIGLVTANIVLGDFEIVESPREATLLRVQATASR
jgi:hypothetical protein